MSLKCAQRGVSLMELLAATLLGVMALSIVGAIFISGQKLATQRSKQLLLIQNLASAALQIKQDLQRAGYDPTAASPVSLTSSSHIVHLESSPSALGYVYRIATTGQEVFRTVVVKHHLSLDAAVGHGLLLCEKQLTGSVSFYHASLSGWNGHCFNLFNPEQISVTEFSVTDAAIVGEGAENQRITIRLSGRLMTDPTIAHQLELTILLRNF